MSKDDYEVGFGRPPKHTRFVPGESGNKGRKKKRPELQSEMIARVRDERVTVNGVTMTMFELAVRSVFTSTIKSGHPRDLKGLSDLLDRYGAIPKGEALAELKFQADNVMDSIMEAFDKMIPDDPPELPMAAD